MTAELGQTARARIRAAEALVATARHHQGQLRALAALLPEPSPLSLAIAAEVGLHDGPPWAATLPQLVVGAHRDRRARARRRGRPRSARAQDVVGARLLPPAPPCQPLRSRVARSASGKSRNCSIPMSKHETK